MTQRLKPDTICITIGGSGAIDRSRPMTLEEFAADTTMRKQASINRQLLDMRRIAAGAVTNGQAALPLSQRMLPVEASREVADLEKRAATLKAENTPDALRAVYEALKATGRLPTL